MPVPEYHRPVLVAEVLRYLPARERPLPGRHGRWRGPRRRAAGALPPDAASWPPTVDREALRAARARLASFAGRVRFVHVSFRKAAEDRRVRAEGLAGALLDLGVSSPPARQRRAGFHLPPWASPWT